jgi:hypothetical protein
MVSTTIGCEGIDVETERHLLIADTPEAFAEATLRLLENRDLANELGRNGRNLIESIYDYRKACGPIDEVYHKSVAGNGATPLRQIKGREQ